MGRCLQDVLQCLLGLRLRFKTSLGHLQNVLARCLACPNKTYLRHLTEIFLPTGLTKICKRIQYLGKLHTAAMKPLPLK